MSKPGNPTPPLHGITVVSIEQAIAAPLCTRGLAELGARVIKIERPDGGDFARHYDDRVNGLSSHFVWANRGKESLTLNLKHPEARTIIARLLETADIFVQNLAPGAAARMKLDYPSLGKKFGQLIVCNISGYGGSGPYASKKAYDLLVQAESGFLQVTGNGGQMAKSGISIADIAAGSQAHAAILAALIQRGKTRAGSCINISMLEAMVEWMGFPLYYAYNGAEPPARTGADHASIYPYGLFVTGDQDIIMLGVQNEREWQGFCGQVLGKPDLALDARFDSNSRRSENRDALKPIIDAAFAKISTEKLIQALEHSQIAYAQVNDLDKVWKHPQLQALQRLVDIESPVGTLKTFLPPGKNSSYEPVIKGIPALGQHTNDILAALGYSESAVQKLREQQII